MNHSSRLLDFYVIIIVIEGYEFCFFFKIFKLISIYLSWRRRGGCGCWTVVSELVDVVVLVVAMRFAGA